MAKQTNGDPAVVLARRLKRYFAIGDTSPSTTNAVVESSRRVARAG
jgi:hypothetical protein